MMLASLAKHFRYLYLGKTYSLPQMLSLEELLHKGGDANYLLLWQTEPAVVIGKYQRYKCEVDDIYLSQNGIALYRRFTGGGAVFMDEGNCNISFIGNKEDFSFDDCAAALIAFLDSIGVTAYTDDRRSIFLQNNKKVSGTAQSIFKDRKIFHATMLLDADLDRLSRALSPHEDYEDIPGVKAVQSKRSPVTNLLQHAAECKTKRALLKQVLHFLQSLGMEKLKDEELCLYTNKEAYKTLLMRNRDEQWIKSR